MRLIKIDPPEGSPLFGWTFETVKEHYMRNPAEKGDLAIIYNSHAGFHQYFLANVLENNHGNQKQIILSRSGLSGGPKFYRSGKNVYCPTGQTRMLPLIPEISKHLSLTIEVMLNN